MNQYGNEIKNLQSSNQDPSLFMRKNPAARLYMAANDVNNQVNKMNQEKKAMLQNKIPLSQVRQIEAAKVDIMKRFNDQVAQIQRQR